MIKKTVNYGKYLNQQHVIETPPQYRSHLVIYMYNYIDECCNLFDERKGIGKRYFIEIQ